MGSRKDLLDLVKGIKRRPKLRKWIFETKKDEREFKIRELRWKVAKAAEKIDVRLDFNGHNHGCDLDFYLKRMKDSLWMSNALTSPRKMHRLLDAMEQDTTVKWPVPLKSFSDETCGECGKRLPITFNGLTFKAESKCQFPEGMPAYSSDLPVPSGKLVVANDLRRLFDDEYEEVVLGENGKGWGFDINTVAGCRQVFETYGLLGMAHGYVGNTCPDMYRIDENTLTLSTIKCDAETWDQIEAEVPGESVAGVCTDLWWYSIMDYDEYVRRAGEKPDNIDDVFFWVMSNVYRHLLDEMSYDPSFGTSEDMELSTEVVVKNMYLFRNFQDHLKLANKTG